METSSNGWLLMKNPCLLLQMTSKNEAYNLLCERPKHQFVACGHQTTLHVNTWKQPSLSLSSN
jgi:hypothetical protein